VVTELDPDKATVRCKFNDSDGLTSYWLRVLHHKTHQDKSYWMPDIGEQVLCICLPNGQEQGFMLGAFYSEVDTCEEFSSPDKDHKQYKDGA
jgi:phage baseplate assembly protein V